jgi:hypothetical protein
VGVAGADADGLEREVDVAPAEREQLAHPEAGEGGREEDRSVLGRVRVADERQDLLGRVDVDRDAAPARLLLDAGHRVRRQPVLLASALQHPMEDREQLVDRAVAEATLAHELGSPGVDPGRRDVLEREPTESRDEMRSNRAAVVVERGPLALAVELDPTQEVVAGLRERDAGAVLAGQHAPARGREQLVQPFFPPCAS